MCTRMRRGVTPAAPCQQRYRDMQGATHEVDRLREDDFSEICSREVIEWAASPIIEEAMAVSGRAVALLASGYMLSVDVRVRLFMDMGHNPGFTGMARILGTLRRWLSWPGGGNLILPDDPEIEYRDAILVGSSDWPELFEAGECTLTFTLFDPIGWSAERMERTARFAVGGDWPKLPEFRVMGASGSYLQVSLPPPARASAWTTTSRAAKPW